MYDEPRKSFQVTIPFPPECPIHYPDAIWKHATVTFSSASVLKTVTYSCGCHISQWNREEWNFIPNNHSLSNEQVKNIMDSYMKDTGGG